MIRPIPLVCWPWCVNGPDFWAQAHVDPGRWRRHLARTAAIDSTVRKLVRRSRETPTGVFYGCPALFTVRKLIIGYNMRRGICSVGRAFTCEL